MNLYFDKKFKWGEETNFEQKIWSGLNHFDINYDSSKKSQFQPKIHTIREDNSNRWDDTKKINFLQWSSRPYHSKAYRFAPILPVVSVQEIEITILKNSFVFCITIDGRVLSDREDELFALNDGFNDIGQLEKYLDGKSFKGKIIHWTNFKY